MPHVHVLVWRRRYCWCRKSNFQASCMEGLRIIFGDENILLLGTIQVSWPSLWLHPKSMFSVKTWMFRPEKWVLSVEVLIGIHAEAPEIESFFSKIKHAGFNKLGKGLECWERRLWGFGHLGLSPNLRIEMMWTHQVSVGLLNRFLSSHSGKIHIPFETQSFRWLTQLVLI